MLAVAATFLLATMWSQGAAAETTRYHGNICKPRYGSQAADFRYYEGGIRNQSGNTRWVSCPVDRELVWYSGPYNTSIWAYVYNAGGTLWCEGYNVNPSTGALTDSYSQNTSLTGNRSLLIKLDAPGSGLPFIRCLLPPYSYVRSFYVYEPE